MGVNTDNIASGNVMVYLGNFLSLNALLIAGISVAAWIAGMLIQFLITSHQKVLPDNSDEKYVQTQNKPSGNGFIDEPGVYEENETGQDL